MSEDKITKLVESEMSAYFDGEYIDNGNARDRLVEFAEACAAIKDAEIAEIRENQKILEADYVERVREIAARDLMIKESAELYAKQHKELLDAQAMIKELRKALESAKDFICVNNMEDSVEVELITEALAKSEHHNSRALEKMLLEARIEELQFADEGYDARTYARLCRLKTELAELNKE